MSITNLNADTDFDLEYHDVVKDPNDPDMAAITAEIPKRFEGKSREDVIQSNINLEKVLRRQGNELGQLRKTLDAQTRLLDSQVNRNTQTLPEPKKPEPITAEKLLNDPETTVNSLVEANPAIDRTNRRLETIERNIAQERFESKNPTYQQDVQSPEFQEWVLASTNRSKLLVKLNNHYDFDAGNDLWELWNEHQQAKQGAEQARQQKVKAATTTKVGASEPAPKAVYSRAKLAELQMRALNGDQAAQTRWNDPTFQQEYQLAYAEGRVR